MLLNAPNRLEREHLQALAWLEHAAGFTAARTVLDRELPKLTPEQNASVATWKRHLLPATAGR